MKFADFELHSVVEELRRNGRPVKLERMPMQLLCLLVSRPGEVFTRAEIIERLWGKGAFLDTDNGVNTAIRKIRIALHDDAEQPRFISTLPGRGYRFVGELVKETENPEISPPASPSSRPSTSSSFTSNPQSVDVSSLPAKSRAICPWMFLGAGVLFCASTILAGSFFWNSAKRSRSQQGRAMLAVLPFVNMSGDPTQDYFVDGMTEELITQLGAMNPESLGVIARTSAMHYKHSNEDIAHIAQELGVAYVLEGSVRRSGDHVRVVGISILDTG